MKGKKEKKIQDIKEIETKVENNNNPINSEKEKSNFKILKIASIIFVGIFILIIIFGLIRLYHFKSSFSKATPEDLANAKLSVSDYLLANGRNVSIEDIRTSEKVKAAHSKNSQKGRIIELYINQENSKEIFLYDIESKAIVMHSKTEFFGKLNASDDNRYGHERFERR